MRRTLAIAGTVVMLLGSAGSAHHSFGAIYLETDMIEVDGNIVEFQYKNPHSWVHVKGTERNGLGEEHVYSGEWVSTSQLERQEITKDTLKPGDKVRMWGSPSKNPTDYRMHLKRLERADGWQWRGQGQQTR
jgi:hypothetical protein